MSAGFADKSKTSAYVFQTDNSNIAADDGGHAISAKSVSISNSAHDQGSIDKAFRFARESLGLVERTVSAEQKMFTESLTKSLAASQSALDKSLGSSIDISESERTGGANRTVYSTVAALVAVVASVYFLNR